MQSAALRGFLSGQASVGAEDMPTVAGLDEALRALFARAKSAWPGIRIDDEVFGQFLGEHVHGSLSTTNDLNRVHVTDLYLACAVSRGEADALAAFEEACTQEIRLAWRRFRDLPDTQEDFQQQLREKLLVGAGRRILEYNGQGSLRSWLRVVITRMLLNLSTRETRQIPSDEAWFDAVLHEGRDAEIEYAREVSRAAFTQAFERSIQDLSSRDQSVLRYAFGDGLTIDDIAAVYGIHRATAARWVAGARRALVRLVRERLIETLRATDSEVASVVRAALSQVNSTLVAYFRPRS